MNCDTLFRAPRLALSKASLLSISAITERKPASPSRRTAITSKWRDLCWLHSAPPSMSTGKGFEDLRHKMEKNLLLVSVGPLEPKVRLVLTSAALQVFIRYPVNAKNAIAIDDRINSELLRAVELEPKLKVVGVEVPTVRRQPYDPATGVRGV
jgi:hypothetical protein